MKQRSNLVAFLVIGVVIVGGILIGTIGAQPIKNQLNAWKLLPQPERLTELYFANPNHLPSTYTPGQPQTVRFTIHNLEYQTMGYRYSVTAQPDNANNTTTPITSGTTKLNQNRSATIPVTAALPDLGPRVKITIALPTVGESIDYWVTRKAT